MGAQSTKNSNPPKQIPTEKPSRAETEQELVEEVKEDPAAEDKHTPMDVTTHK